MWPQDWTLLVKGMPLIDIIAGARPNFVKIAPIISALKKQSRQGSLLSYRLVHTGQHYDQLMSGDFFAQLGIPEPDVNLEVGSGTQARQTGKIMLGYEKLLLNSRSDLCLVVGDVTSTMACAISAQKLRVPVAHVEAGIRSGDWSMPEEINRIVTDSITNWFFTTSESASENLHKAGVSWDRIFFVGNTMIDTLLLNQNRLSPPAFWKALGLNNEEYIVLTLHRPSNVDQYESFSKLLLSIGEQSRGLPVVFPAHPRTIKTLSQIGALPSNIFQVEPQPYLQFNYLLKHAKLVITDSGGITEEATVLKIPCITLRDSTERPETVTIGTNELIGSNPVALAPYLDRLFAGKWKKGLVPDKWDGKASERIVGQLSKLLCD